MLIYKRILTLLSAIVLILLIVTAAHSQGRPVTSDSASVIAATPAASNTDLCTNVADCLKVIDKLLSDLDGKDEVVAAKTAENANLRIVVKDQDERFAKMLKILQDFASVEKKDKKSFWKAVGNYLKGVLKTVSDPETIRSILDVIVLIKALER